VGKVKRIKVVVIGGGTGTFVVLSGLRDYPIELTAIVSMMDSGGSNRVWRDEFGLLPTSDIRQCLVALAEDKGDQEILRQLFTYRFHQGVGISGMTFGNLFMAALADIYKDQVKALEVVQRLLHIKGKILPVTLDDVHLVARYENGHQVVGEHAIDEPRHDGRLKIVEMETIPKAKIYPPAQKAILTADLIIFGPGDLYTSLVPNLVVEGVTPAIARSQAKKLFIINLMTKYGQTYNYKASDFIKDLEKYLGQGILTHVFVNQKLDLPKKFLEKYQQEHAVPVENDLERRYDFEVVHTNFVSHKIFQKPAGDRLFRSPLRHDPAVLAREITKLFPMI